MPSGTKPELTPMQWVDDNYNNKVSYGADTGRTFGTARRQLNLLVNCINCTNCVQCINCIGCDTCAFCVGCVKCERMGHLINKKFNMGV